MQPSSPPSPHTSDLLIRDATQADMASIQAIYAWHVLNGIATFEEIPPGLEDMRQRRQAVLDLGLPYLVAELDGKIAGYCYAGHYRARSAYRYTVENSVYLHHELSGRGIGLALMNELIARCERGPWRQMIAVIGDRANASSIALHAKLGFAHMGVLRDVGFKHGRWVDIVLMQRPLGQGASAPPQAV